MSKKYPTFDESRQYIDWAISGAWLLNSISRDAAVQNTCDHLNEMGHVVALAWRRYPEHRYYLWNNTKDLLV